MVDEGSTDGTPEKLSQLGVPTAHSEGGKGVTYNWNLVRGCHPGWVAQPSQHREMSGCVHACAVFQAC